MKTSGNSRRGGLDRILWELTVSLAIAGGLAAVVAGLTAGQYGKSVASADETPAKQSDKADKAGTAEKADKADKADKVDKAEKSDKSDKTDNAEKSAESDKAETPAETPAKTPARTSAKKRAGEPADLSYMRVRRGANKTAEALETSILRFLREEPDKPSVQVDLVGVVHIGERAYYDELNQLFKEYDAVLYELVAPEGTRVPKGGGKGGANPISALQKGLQSMLALEYQLEHIDYHASNFIHADMTPEEMSQSMADRKESWFQMMLKMMGQGMAQQSRQPGGDINLFGALFAKDRPVRMKRIFAQQFEDMEGLSAFDGPEGSTLITERNKKALRVLDRELMAGKRRIAIFYGAGHMKDMEDRLINEFKMRRVSATWLTAWRMDGAPAAAKPDAAKPDAVK